MWRNLRIRTRAQQCIDSSRRKVQFTRASIKSNRCALPSSREPACRFCCSNRGRDDEDRLPAGANAAGVVSPLSLSPNVTSAILSTETLPSNFPIARTESSLITGRSPPERACGASRENSRHHCIARANSATDSIEGGVAKRTLSSPAKQAPSGSSTPQLYQFLAPPARVPQLQPPHGWRVAGLPSPPTRGCWA